MSQIPISERTSIPHVLFCLLITPHILCDEWAFCYATIQSSHASNCVSQSSIKMFSRMSLLFHWPSCAQLVFLASERHLTFPALCTPMRLHVEVRKERCQSSIDQCAGWKLRQSHMRARYIVVQAGSQGKVIRPKMCEKWYKKQTHILLLLDWQR